NPRLAGKTADDGTPRTQPSGGGSGKRHHRGGNDPRPPRLGGAARPIGRNRGASPGPSVRRKLTRPEALKRNTTMKYEGFIFGHYDSRGGAVFIAGGTEAEARKAYAESGQPLQEQFEDAAQWANDEGAHPMWKQIAEAETEEEKIRILTEEDFYGPATIESYR